MSSDRLNLLISAVYLDTNTIFEVGPDLNSEWMDGLRSFSKEYGVQLCITELVLDEWSGHIFKKFKDQRNQLQTNLKSLSVFIEMPEIKVPLVDLTRIREILLQRLQKAGFSIIKNYDGPLEKFIREAVSKTPPFKSQDKGFRDALILESCIIHALNELPKNPRVLVISRDTDVKNSGVRFTQHGIKITFVDPDSAVKELNASLDDLVAAILKNRDEHWMQFAKSHEKEIFEFINKSFIDFDFRSPLRSLLLSLDNKIEGSIEQILKASPTQITRVVTGVFPLTALPPDRHPVDIWVEMELEVVVSSFSYPGTFRQPATIEEKALLNVARHIQKTETLQKIKHRVKVEATVDAKSVSDPNPKGFRPERVF